MCLSRSLPLLKLALCHSNSYHVVANGTAAGVNAYFNQEGITKAMFLSNGGLLPWPRTVLDYLTTMTLSEAGLWWQATFAFSSNYSVMNQLDHNEFKDFSWIGYFNYYMVSFFGSCYSPPNF